MSIQQQDYCISGNCSIATESFQEVSISDLYKKNKPVKIWSYDLEEKAFQIKEAKPMYTGMKRMYEIRLNREVKIWMSTRQSVMNENGEWISVGNVNPTENFYGFHQDHDSLEVNLIFETFTKTDRAIFLPTYSFEVADNANFIILSDTKASDRVGILCKGMELQFT